MSEPAGCELWALALLYLGATIVIAASASMAVIVWGLLP